MSILFDVTWCSLIVDSCLSKDKLQFVCRCMCSEANADKIQALPCGGDQGVRSVRRYVWPGYPRPFGPPTRPLVFTYVSVSEKNLGKVKFFSRKEALEQYSIFKYSAILCTLDCQEHIHTNQETLLPIGRTLKI